MTATDPTPCHLALPHTEHRWDTEDRVNLRYTCPGNATAAELLADITDAPAQPADRPVDNAIAAVLAARSHHGSSFIPTRYPFTYSADFFRANAVFFDHDPSDERLGSRASFPAREYARRTGQDELETIVALADAYLTLHGIDATPEEKDAALAHQRVTAWKSMGLSAPAS